jgi:glycerol-3-phosphate dehydrogenase (NAD(P)+)
MKLIVIGSGNWGTVLANLFAENQTVYLWTLTTAEANEINIHRENKQFLPGVKLSENIIAEVKYSRTIEADDIVVVVVPSRKIAELATELKSRNYEQFILVNASKGVRHDNLKTICEIFYEILPEVRFANLSGPTIAREFTEGLPAKAVLASHDIDLLFLCQTRLKNSLLHFEFSTDVKGVELASSLKGLIAIAIGIVDGLGYKTNIYGLIMTYGLSEFGSLMDFLRVDPKTIYGIAGMGDLITTCLSENSRNRQFGKLLAQGYSTDEALHRVGMEVEGVSMAKTVKKFAALQLPLPLITFVTEAIFNSNIKVSKEKRIKILKESLLRAIGMINTTGGDSL